MERLDECCSLQNNKGRESFAGPEQLIRMIMATAALAMLIRVHLATTTTTTTTKVDDERCQPVGFSHSPTVALCDGSQIPVAC